MTFSKNVIFEFFLLVTLHFHCTFVVLVVIGTLSVEVCPYRERVRI